MLVALANLLPPEISGAKRSIGASVHVPLSELGKSRSLWRASCSQVTGDRMPREELVLTLNRLGAETSLTTAPLAGRQEPPAGALILRTSGARSSGHLELVEALGAPGTMGMSLSGEDGVLSKTSKPCTACYRSPPALCVDSLRERRASVGR